MSADLSKPVPPTMQLDEPFERGSAGGWTGMAVVLAIGALAAAGAGWLGYRAQLGASSAAPSLSTAPEPARSADAGTRQAQAMSRSHEAAPTRRSEPPPSGGKIDGTKLSWPMWEFRLREPIPPRTPSLTPPTWRLIGSSLAAGKWSIIVLRQGKPEPEYFSVGQELPGGYRILAIDDQDVTLVQGQRTMVLSYLGSR